VTVDREKTLAHVLGVAREAGQGIARIYAGEFDVEYKAKNDPVTRADREANDFICAELARAYPGMPIVAEESDPASYAGFSKSSHVWFVDPLDGTREFVARNGEFAVMIGLAEHGRAVLGVLVCPALGRSFIGADGTGAFELNDQGDRKPIHVSAHGELVGGRVLISRSHLPEEARAHIAALGLVTIPCGSAGVKAAKIACGEGDLYAQPGRAGKLWDACAPEAVVRAAGGVWRTTTGDGYDYASESLENGRGVLAGNARLVEAVIAAMKW
jgi:3'(2'), 5'-bisphosphate nucleotidase